MIYYAYNIWNGGEWLMIKFVYENGSIANFDRKNFQN